MLGPVRWFAAAFAGSRGRQAGPPHQGTRIGPPPHGGTVTPENQNNLTFEELGLSPVLLKTVTEEGYTEPTPVQERAIPLVLQGRDVLAAKHGVGR